VRRIDIVVALLFLVVPLIAFARRANVAYPIVLVIGGLALGFVPGLPPVGFPSDTVLLVFLPPLLYWEALNAPLEQMARDAGVIRTLVVGLVIATMAGVAVVAHAMIPNMPWPAAFVLGAVVAPTDAVAFSSIGARLGVAHRTIAIIEAEGLLNDATALVFYASAVAAVVSGTFSLGATLVAFIVSCACAVLIGGAIGALVLLVWRNVRDADLQVAVSVLAPYLAYLPAQEFNVSGVLAVVITGLLINRFSSGVLRPEARERGAGFWQTTVFLMNALIFIVVGLQLHPILTALSVYSRGRLIVVALAISAVVIIIRLAWLFGQRAIFRYRIAANPADEWKHRLVTGWAGFRGGISLAAALAIPLTTAAGAEFPRRQLTIFLTFGVIFITLVGQGLTLPVLISRLKLQEPDAPDLKARRTIAHISAVALKHLRTLERQEFVGRDAAEALRRHYENRKRRFSARSSAAASTAAPLHGYDRAAREVMRVQRAELLEMHRRGRIDGTTLAHIEAMLDLEELGLEKLAATDLPTGPR
jgi:Na+/H+ antiporter